jgi:hypothetical protein
MATDKRIRIKGRIFRQQGAVAGRCCQNNKSTNQSIFQFWGNVTFNDHKTSTQSKKIIGANEVRRWTGIVAERKGMMN